MGGTKRPPGLPKAGLCGLWLFFIDFLRVFLYFGVRTGGGTPYKGVRTGRGTIITAVSVVGDHGVTKGVSQICF